MKFFFLSVFCLIGLLGYAQEKLIFAAELRLPEAGVLCFSPDGQILAVAVARSVLLVNTRTWEKHAVLEGHEATVSALAFSTDGTLLLTGSWDRTARLWSVETGEIQRVITGPSAWVVAVAIHPARTWVALGSYDERFRLGFIYWMRLDVTWPPRAKLAHGGWVRALAFSPDGKLLASGAEDKTVKLWDVESGEERAQLSGHPGGVRTLAFSPDGKRLAVGSWREVWVWDVLQGKRVGAVSAHTGEVRAVAFSPRGDLLASGGADGWVKLWAADTLALVEALQVLVPKAAHAAVGPQGILSLAFSPEGDWLAASGSDGKVRVWQVVRP